MLSRCFIGWYTQTDDLSDILGAVRKRLFLIFQTLIISIKPNKKIPVFRVTRP